MYSHLPRKMFVWWVLIFISFPHLKERGVKKGKRAVQCTFCDYPRQTVSILSIRLERCQTKHQHSINTKSLLLYRLLVQNSIFISRINTNTQLNICAILCQNLYGTLFAQIFCSGTEITLFALYLVPI